MRETQYNGCWVFQSWECSHILPLLKSLVIPLLEYCPIKILMHISRELFYHSGACVAFVTLIFSWTTYWLATREILYVICGLLTLVACSVSLAEHGSLLAGWHWSLLECNGGLSWWNAMDSPGGWWVVSLFLTHGPLFCHGECPWKIFNTVLQAQVSVKGSRHVQAIKVIQRMFTYKITEVQLLNYWERQDEHRLYSRQRCCVYVWKITQHMVPNIDGTMGHKIETRKHPRHVTQSVIQ